MSWMNIRPIVLAVSILALAATPLMAQQHFTLSDEDDWEAVEPVDPATPAGALALAREALAQQRPKRAADLATRWIEQHGQDPLLPEAYLLRADALRAQENYYDALFDYEFIARAFPGSEVFPIALSRELEIARMFASGMKRKWLGMRIVSASDEAEELLIRIQERMPGSQLAEEAGITLGDFYFERRQMKLAVDAYDLFLQNYPDSPYLRKARWRLVFAHLATFKGPEFDPAGLNEANAWLSRIRNLEPAAAEQAAALQVRIAESEAQKLLETALWYRRQGDAITTEFSFRRLITRYPTSVATAQALRVLPELLESLPESVREDARRAQVYPPAVFGERSSASVTP